MPRRSLRPRPDVEPGLDTRRVTAQMLTETWDAVIRARGSFSTRWPLAIVPRRRRHREIAACGGAGSARQRLATLVVRGIRNDPPDRYRRLLESARADKDRAERELAEKSAQFRDDRSRTRILAADVTAALPPEARS